MVSLGAALHPTTEWTLPVWVLRAHPHMLPHTLPYAILLAIWALEDLILFWLPRSMSDLHMVPDDLCTCIGHATFLTSMAPTFLACFFMLPQHLPWCQGFVTLAAGVTSALVDVHVVPQTVICLEDLVAHWTLLLLFGHCGQAVWDWLCWSHPCRRHSTAYQRLLSTGAASSAPACQLPPDEALVQPLPWYWFPPMLLQKKEQLHYSDPWGRWLPRQQLKVTKINKRMTILWTMWPNTYL